MPKQVVKIKREEPFGLDQSLVVQIPWWEHAGTPDAKEQLTEFEFFPARIPGVVAMAINGTRVKSNSDAMWDFFRACMDDAEFDRLYTFLNDGSKRVKASEIGPVIDAIMEFEAERPTPQPSS